MERTYSCPKKFFTFIYARIYYFSFSEGTNVLPNEITVTEAQKMSAYARCHIYNLINTGKLKARHAKLRGSPPLILIERTSLEAYMREQERPINGEATINR